MAETEHSDWLISITASTASSFTLHWLSQNKSEHPFSLLHSVITSGSTLPLTISFTSRRSLETEPPDHESLQMYVSIFHLFHCLVYYPSSHGGSFDPRTSFPGPVPSPISHPMRLVITGQDKMSWGDGLFIWTHTGPHSTLPVSVNTRSDAVERQVQSIQSVLGLGCLDPHWRGSVTPHIRNALTFDTLYKIPTNQTFTLL